MTVAIHAEGLTKYYGPVIGVEDLDLIVPTGIVYGFLGPNGAGKTTTIRLLLDLIRPTKGRVRVDGLDCQRASRAVRARVGYLPGEMPLYGEMTGGAYLTFLAALHASPPNAAWLTTLLRRFDVSDIDMQRRMRDLSHGMKRKFGIIQALMGQARVLILDEPTSGLDPLMIEAFAETVEEVKASGRSTIFLSSHVLSEVERLCDRVGVVRRGHLVRETSLADLRRDMPRRVRLVFDGMVPTPPPHIAALLRRQSSNEWILDWSGPLGALLAVIPQATVQDIEIEPFKLEEYVLQHYADEGRRQP